MVQKCIKSVVEFSERPVIKLDAKSVEKYIQLPNDIRQKYTSGKMSDAALSDLIRFSLLEHFGGTWIDASGLIIHVLIMCNMDEKLFLIKKITKRK